MLSPFSRSAAAVAHPPAQSALPALAARGPASALSLRVVPTAAVVPHEEFDERRVQQLAQRLRADGVLRNPPIVAELPASAASGEDAATRYVVLDGATRVSAAQRMGCPHLVVQVAGGVQLRSWNHVLRRVDRGGRVNGKEESGEAALLALIADVPGLRLAPAPAPVDGAGAAQGRLTTAAGSAFDLHLASPARNDTAHGDWGDWLEPLTKLVQAYGTWGNVERTLSQDLEEMQALYSDVVALVEFPRLRLETVLDVARRGQRLPAGITRFVVPGRILRLNAPLALLAGAEPLAQKREWLDQFLRHKLDQRGVRRYEEPVVLLDE